MIESEHTVGSQTLYQAFSPESESIFSEDFDELEESRGPCVSTGGIRMSVYLSLNVSVCILFCCTTRSFFAYQRMFDVGANCSSVIAQSIRLPRFADKRYAD